MTKAPNQNPYATPMGDATVDGEATSILEEGERILFEGTVQKQTLLRSLRPRFSWGGLATLGIGALVCLVGAPPSFLNPFERPSLIYVDIVAEQLGLIGLGLIVISCWHLYAMFAGYSVDRRERHLLHQSPNLYVRHKTGWLDAECIHVRDENSAAWISWHGVGHYQLAQDVLLIDWNAGISGTSVLTADLFPSQNTFRRAGKLMEQSTQPLSYDRLVKLDDYFPFKNLASFLPKEEDVVAEFRQTTTGKDAWESITRRVPEAIFSNSRPLHYFFVGMGLVSLIFVQRWWVSLGLLATLWLIIMVLGVLLSYYQILGLRRRGDTRLLASTTKFTSDTAHIHTTVAYLQIPLDSFSVAKRTADRIVLNHRDTTVTNSLERESFRSEEEWNALCELFEQRPADDSV